MVEHARLIHRIGQLTFVLTAFLLSIIVLILPGARGVGASQTAAVVEALFLTALVVRYWWVILLLDWPFTLARVALLIGVWLAALGSALAASALQSDDFRGWIATLAVVCALGALTESYNYVHRQWEAHSAALTASLKRDHIVGGVAAGIGALALIAAGYLLPGSWAIAAAGFVIALDWIRLIEMIGRHRRLLREGAGR